jgi:hypothetical protein
MLRLSTNTLTVTPFCLLRLTLRRVTPPDHTACGLAVAPRTRLG